MDGLSEYLDFIVQFFKIGFFLLVALVTIGAFYFFTHYQIVALE